MCVVGAGEYLAAHVAKQRAVHTDQRVGGDPGLGVTSIAVADDDSAGSSALPRKHGAPPRALQSSNGGLCPICGPDLLSADLRSDVVAPRRSAAPFAFATTAASSKHSGSERSSLRLTTQTPAAGYFRHSEVGALGSPRSTGGCPESAITQPTRTGLS
jgi:hypothetical protein